MFDYEVEDSRLQGFLKNAIRLKGPVIEKKLRLLVNCGTYGDLRMGVHVLANGKQSKILGVRTCGHSWVCPYCTARQMSKYASRIDAAIQALEAQQNLVPVMATFTVFHTAEYSAGEMFDLLTRAYTLFNKGAGYRKKSETTGKIYGSGALSNFTNDLNIKHKIKASEVTYGQHGWHPHYHILYFIKKSDLSKVAQYEESLKDLWNRCVNNAFLELFPERWVSWSYLNKKYLADESKTHKGFYITKDDKGEVTAVNAAQYCCGFDIHWDASKELTGGSGYEKTANEGHFTPRQLLEKAYEGDEKALDRYLELAQVVITRRQHRVDFSRSGINTIIAQWMNTQGYKEYIKKKNISALKAQSITPFRTVCWFTAKQWAEICFEEYDNPYIIVLIRRFAVCEDIDFAYQLICELMQANHLSIPQRYPPFDISDAYNSCISGEFDLTQIFNYGKVPELVPLDLSFLRKTA